MVSPGSQAQPLLSLIRMVVTGKCKSYVCVTGGGQGWAAWGVNMENGV